MAGFALRRHFAGHSGRSAQYGPMDRISFSRIMKVLYIFMHSRKRKIRSKFSLYASVYESAFDCSKGRMP